MDNFKISQSSFKAFYVPDFCPKQWYKNYVLRDRESQVPSDAQLMGQVFEYKAIGATVSGNVPEIPKVNVKNNKPNTSTRKADIIKYLRRKGVSFDENYTIPVLLDIVAGLPDDYTEGEPSATEKEIDSCVAFFHQYDKAHGIKTIDVQVRLISEQMIGDVDRITTQRIDGEEKIQLRDLKFTATKYEREYYNGWSQPADEAYNRWRKVNDESYRETEYLEGFLMAETLAERVNYMQGLTFYERSIIQAVHYCILYNEMHGIWPQFYFEIYGKSGWSRIRQVVLTWETVENHYAAMDVFADDLTPHIEAGFDYAPKYAACMSCDYAGQCEFFQKFPEVETTQFQRA